MDTLDPTPRPAAEPATDRLITNLGKGLVQVNLRLNRITELLERGSAPSSQASPHLDSLLDLLEAVDQTLAAARAPAPSRPWWRALAGPAPAVDLQGLALAREHVLGQLEQAGIEPISTSGKVDPRQHQVIEALIPEDPALAGTIARTHRQGWIRRGDPPTLLRLSQVSAWRTQEV